MCCQIFEKKLIINLFLFLGIIIVLIFIQWYGFMTCTKEELILLRIKEDVCVNLFIYLIIIHVILIWMFVYIIIEKKIYWVVLFLMIIFILYQWYHIDILHATHQEFKFFRLVKKSMLYHLLGNINEIKPYIWWLTENTNNNIFRIPFGNINMGYKGIKCDGFQFCTITQMILDKYEFKNFFMLEEDYSILEKIKDLLKEYHDMKIIIFTDNAKYVLEVINKSENYELKELLNTRLYITDGKKLFSEINEEILNQKINNTTELLRSFLPDKKNMKLDDVIRELNNHDYNTVSKALNLKNNIKTDILSRKWDVNHVNYNTNNILRNKIKERNLIIEAVKNLIDNKK